MRYACYLCVVCLPLCLAARTTTAADAPATAAQPIATKAAAPHPLSSSEASQASAQTDEKELRPAEQLPAPLHGIASNLVQLEETGFFEITRVVFGRNEDFGDEAIIWTVKAKRPITYRHATILLRRFSDVRFYHSEEDMDKELYASELYYSPRITEGAVHGEILHQDMEFDAWVSMPPEKVMLLNREKADAVVFHEPQTVRLRLVVGPQTPWNSRGSSGTPRWLPASSKSE